MRRRVSSRLQEYPFLSKISFCSHAAEAILFVDLKETAKHDVIIPDYSKYSAFWSRMFGIHSMYSGIGIASQSNGCSGTGIATIERTLNFRIDNVTIP